MTNKRPMPVGEKRNKLLCLLETPKPSHVTTKYKRYGLFRCDCGKAVIVSYDSWKYGRTKSCGCIQSEANTKHGYAKQNKRLYDCYKAMMARCYIETHPNYNNYGAKGVRVCDRWHNIHNFFIDMLPTYQDGLSLDREDVESDYSFENCSWRDRSWQSFNQRLGVSNTSGKTGVCWNKEKAKWETRINTQGNNVFLGYYETFDEAVEAREKAELKYFGRLKGN